MSSNTPKILKVCYVLSYIIFIGLCIEAGALSFNTVYALFNPIVAQYFYKWMDLSDIYSFSTNYFLSFAFLLALVPAVKAYMFYLIIKIFQTKNFSLPHPFVHSTKVFFLQMSYLSFIIGLISLITQWYMQWLSDNALSLTHPYFHSFYSADVWIFTWIIFFIIWKLFQKGIDIQSESELTI